MPHRHRLFLLRHAKSSWSEPGLADRERPLAKRGRRAVGLLSAHLRNAALAPDLVLCSSATRARETLAGVRDGLPAQIAVEVEDGLYAADARTLLDRLRGLPEEVGSVMLVGHNPGLEDLASDLVGDGDPEARASMAIKYPTGALATLAIDPAWRDLAPGRARLEAFVVPRRLE